MNITKELLERDPSLQQHLEGKWNVPFDGSVGYTSFNDAGLECETGEFLYAMVRILQPQNVLETGTHHGVGASYIGSALRDNKKGRLDTIEFNAENYHIAKERMQTLGLEEYVTQHLMDARNFRATDDHYDIILLDTEPELRFGELIRYMPSLAEGGYVFIHDLHRHMHQIPNEEHGFAWPYGKLPEQIVQWVNDGILRPFHFPTPRGLTGFYKVKAEDYQWQK